MSNRPPRHIDLAGATNFRDLGGYASQSGSAVRWRRIFRSNHLAKLSNTDVEIVRGLGIRHAFDFRGVEERAEATYDIAGLSVHSLPIEPTVVAALRTIADAGKPLSAAAAAEVMRDSYRNYVQHNTGRFRSLFGKLLECDEPVVIHCTAGKDRTGFACALVLNALGIPGELILEDYLLTNRYYRRDPAAASDLPDDVRQVLGAVQPSFLAAAFAAIEADYGDLDCYFRDGVGLGPAERSEFKRRYLQT